MEGSAGGFGGGGGGVVTVSMRSFLVLGSIVIGDVLWRSFVGVVLREV